MPLGREVRDSAGPQGFNAYLRGRFLFWGFLAPALPCNPFLHHLPWLEDDVAFLGHHDRLTRPWVAGFPGLMLLHFKDAKVAKLDAAFCGHRAHDGIKDVLDDLLDLDLCQADLLRNRPDDGSLGHELIPLALEMLPITAMTSFKQVPYVPPTPPPASDP